MDKAGADETAPELGRAKRQDLEVGTVTRAHGLRGELRVRLHNPASGAAERPDALRLSGALGRLDQLECRAGNPGILIVRVPEITSREQANAWRGAQLMLDRNAVDLDEGQYLYRDLIGCDVLEGHERVGRVVDVFEAGASDVLVVQGDTHQRMIPLVEPWVTGVDVARQTIHVSGAEQFDATKIDGR